MSNTTETFLIELRKSVLPGDPLEKRLTILRQLSAVPGAENIWQDDIFEHETVRLTRIEKEVKEKQLSEAELREISLELRRCSNRHPSIVALRTELVKRLDVRVNCYLQGLCLFIIMGGTTLCLGLQHFKGEILPFGVFLLGMAFCVLPHLLAVVFCDNIKSLVLQITNPDKDSQKHSTFGVFDQNQEFSTAIAILVWSVFPAIYLCLGLIWFEWSFIMATLITAVVTVTWILLCLFLTEEYIKKYLL